MEDLLPLLAVAAYWLYRAINRKNKKPPANASPLVAQGKKAPTPFEQLMAQLEQALEEPKAADPTDAGAEVEPPRPVARQAERPPAPRAAPRPPRAVPIGFDSGGDALAENERFDHDEHGFGRDNPLSEEVFEARPRFAPRPKKRVEAVDPHGLKRRASKASPSNATSRGRAVSWAERLHDPAAAREALVLKTIFEGPWSRRSGRIK